MFKLYYVNHLRQVLSSNGKLLNSKDGSSCHENFNDVKAARKVAIKFVNENPLMSCLLINEENEEIIISASESKYETVKVEEKIHIKREEAKK